jgi:hypothetical protein
MVMSQGHILVVPEPSNEKANARNANVPRPLTCQQIPLS